MARFGVIQDDMAAALGVTRAAVSRKLRGLRPITLEELAVFARVLGLTPADLLAPAPGNHPWHAETPDNTVAAGGSCGCARRDSNPQPSDP